MVRYYDPTTGQFLSRDPIVSSTRSAYAYVYGNPLNMTDPSGLCGWGDPFDCVVPDDMGGMIDDATPDCFAWQDGCDSIITRATDGGTCSRFFDEGCTEPRAEFKAQVCPLYGCVSVTYDGHSFHHHEGLGLAVSVGMSLSSSMTSCEPHQEAFLNTPLAGGSLANSKDSPSDWNGSWSVGASPKYPFNWGIGFVHWFN